jgi:hypothetical protein
MHLLNEESETLVLLSKRYFAKETNTWWWRVDVNYNINCFICNKCISNLKDMSAAETEEIVSIHGIQHLKEHKLLVFI